jgi:hypothetical protein
MTVTTTAHSSWTAQADDTPAGGIPVVLDATTGHARSTPDNAQLIERMQRLMTAATPTGDAAARSRIAAALHQVTGWDVFAEDAEADRAYVSRLWAEDWDSPEDAIYDER